MLQSQIRDAAVAAAKAQSHDLVRVAHVVYAAARQLRNDPTVSAWLPLARRGLGARGSAVDVPTIDADAEALLSTLTSEEKLLELLRTTFGKSNQTSDLNAESDVLVVADATAPGTTAPMKQPLPTESVADVMADLDGLIGLDNVKAQLRRVAAVVQANLERSKAGLAPVSASLHLVFTGAPGTGKTTVARLVARLYAATGALPGSNFTEASRADLVAGFVGQTAIKTAEIIRRTRPGVLFIDEAYSLAPSHHGDFGAEAIATLVKSMEDFREDFAVIAAGYGEEMVTLIASNPGLKSRFKTFVDFPDFTAPELTCIFEQLGRSAGVRFGPGVLEKAGQVLQVASGQEAYGNARFARQLFEEAYAHMCDRAAADGLVELHEIEELTVEDVQWNPGPDSQGSRKIGFGGDA